MALNVAALPPEHVPVLQGWIFMVHHSVKCSVSPHCKYGQRCATTRELLVHQAGCANAACGTESCVQLRQIMEHFAQCASTECVLCAPIRFQVQKSRSTSLTRRRISAGARLA